MSFFVYLSINRRATTFLGLLIEISVFFGFILPGQGRYGPFFDIIHGCPGRIATPEIPGHAADFERKSEKSVFGETEIALRESQENNVLPSLPQNDNTVTGKI